MSNENPFSHLFQVVSQLESLGHMISQILAGCTEGAPSEIVALCLGHGIFRGGVIRVLAHELQQFPGIVTIPTNVDGPSGSGVIKPSMNSFLKQLNSESTGQHEAQQTSSSDRPSSHAYLSLTANREIMDIIGQLDFFNNACNFILSGCSQGASKEVVALCLGQCIFMGGVIKLLNSKLREILGEFGNETANEQGSAGSMASLLAFVLNSRFVQKVNPEVAANSAVKQEPPRSTITESVPTTSQPKSDPSVSPTKTGMQTTTIEVLSVPPTDITANKIQPVAHQAVLGRKLKQQMKKQARGKKNKRKRGIGQPKVFGTQPATCELCKKTLISDYGLRRHKRDVHKMFYNV